jgi:Bacterial transcriptional repressor C-terminal
LVRTRPELGPRVRDAFERLYREGERAVVENLAKRGWQIRASAQAEARGFWAALLGVGLEQAAFGSAFRHAIAEATAQLVLNLYAPHKNQNPSSADDDHDASRQAAKDPELRLAHTRARSEKLDSIWRLAEASR